jgi:hypothetical protein
MSFVEGKHVKSIEGVPVSEKDQERLRHDNELGITHWNNIKGAKPKEPKEPKGKKVRAGVLFHRKHNAGEEIHIGEDVIEERAGKLVT